MIQHDIVIIGGGPAGLAAAAALSDFTFMAENGKLFVNSPNTIPGNTADKCDTASAKFQSEESGIVDGVGSEEEILDEIRSLVAILPANNEDNDAYDECTDDLNRVCADLENAAEDAHERDVAAGAVERLANAGDAASGVGRVDGESDELAARARKRKHLGDARLDVGRRGVRHRLHDDRVHAADRHDAAAPGDLDGVGLATEFKGVFRHGLSLREIRTGRRPV